MVRPLRDHRALGAHLFLCSVLDRSRAQQSGQILFCNGMQAVMGLKVAKAHKLGGPAWEVRSPQPVSSRPHALCRTSRARPLPGGPSPGLRNVSSLFCGFCACALAAGPPNIPRYLARRPSALSMRLPCPSFLLCLLSSLVQPLPTSSSWMHHHRAPFSPHLKWASRVIELENATNRRGSSLCHPGQFVSASAVLPRPAMLLCHAMQCCYRQSTVIPARRRPRS